MRKPRKTFQVLAAAALCSAVGAAIAYAQPKGKPSEGQQAAQAIESALQKHGGDVHRCFEKVLADRLDAAGMVEVTVAVGKAGKVTSAKVKKADKSANPALAACVEKAALDWTIEGIEAGASVVLPFSFKAQTSQFLINAADVPERALGAPGTSKGRVGPKRSVPFTVKVLADQTNVKARDLSVTMLAVGPASRVAMQRHPHSGKILYLVKGHGRILGPEGIAPVRLEEGTGVYIPPGYPHAIENMGRQSTGELLQVFSPPGPERVYRDPKDARGRADFEVIHDPASAKVTPEQAAKVVVAAAADVKAVALPGGLGNVKNLIASGPGQPMSLSQLELTDGAELQSKGDPAATVAMYFISGAGTLNVAGETLPVAAESLVYLPRGTPYTLKVAAAEKGEKILAVQFKVSDLFKVHGTPAAAGAVRK